MSTPYTPSWLGRPKFAHAQWGQQLLTTPTSFAALGIIHLVPLDPTTMTDYANVEAIRSLRQTEVNKMTNVQLKTALNTLLASYNAAAEQANNVLLSEIRELRKQVADLQSIRHEMQDQRKRLDDALQDQSRRLDDAFTIISNQQQFLEAMDGRERRLNLVITGLAEDADEIGATDDEKVRKVIEATGYRGTINAAVWELKRLGEQDERKKRPLLVVVADGRVRDNIVKGGKNLKSIEGPLSRVYVKKDVHPVIRKETARLRQRERDEKRKQANAGRDVRYDWQRRVLLLDGNVIDRFCPYFA